MNTQESNSPHEKDLPRWLTIGGPLVALFLLVVAFGYYFYNFHGSLSPAHDKWGQFGDFIGGVLNPLFGFLAFILLLSTLHLQNRELQNSSHELAKSAEALKLQHDALVLQNFENTFFQLLRRIGDLVNQTRYFSKTGRDAFRDLYSEQLCDSYSPQFVGSDRLKNVVQAYEAFYSEYRRELGHYFRSLYHVFTFIDRSHLSDKDKSIYANIARAQLSTYELCLLFYNGVWGEGKEGFKPLIEKYGILKHVDERDLIDPEDMRNKDFYQPTAFMGREERLRYAVSLPGILRKADERIFGFFNDIK